MNDHDELKSRLIAGCKCNLCKIGACCCDTMAEASDTITALTARVAELEEVLDECETYFDNRADAEYFTDSPIPVGNEEMGLLVTVRKALKGGDA